MKYILSLGLMLLCNEILSIVALILLTVFFLSDIAKEAKT